MFGVTRRVASSLLLLLLLLLLIGITVADELIVAVADATRAVRGRVSLAACFAIRVMMMVVVIIVRMMVVRVSARARLMQRRRASGALMLLLLAVAELLLLLLHGVYLERLVLGVELLDTVALLDARDQSGEADEGREAAQRAYDYVGDEEVAVAVVVVVVRCGLLGIWRRRELELMERVGAVLAQENGEVERRPRDGEREARGARVHAERHVERVVDERVDGVVVSRIGIGIGRCAVKVEFKLYECLFG